MVYVAMSDILICKFSILRPLMVMNTYWTWYGAEVWRYLSYLILEKYLFILFPCGGGLAQGGALDKDTQGGYLLTVSSIPGQRRINCPGWS